MCTGRYLRIRIRGLGDHSEFYTWRRYLYAGAHQLFGQAWKGENDVPGSCAAGGTYASRTGKPRGHYYRA